MWYTMSKSLIFYQFFEKNQTYLDNLAHFLAFGYSKENDYVIVIAGECSVDLPEAPNITYLRVENQNLDFGGFAKALASGVAYKKYQYVLFLNCSARGPYLPSYLDLDQWTLPFINGLNSAIGLFGSSICVPENDPKLLALAKKQYPERETFPHVQTYAYAMETATLEKLVKHGFFAEKPELTKHEIIAEYEIALSQEVMNLDFNIGCLLPEYQVNYLRGETVNNPASIYGDPAMPDELFGRTVHPYEVVMAKTERGLYGEYLDLLAHAQFALEDQVHFAEHALVSAYRKRVEATVAAKSASERARLEKAVFAKTRDEAKQKRRTLRKAIGRVSRAVRSRLGSN